MRPQLIKRLYLMWEPKGRSQGVSAPPNTKFYLTKELKVILVFQRNDSVLEFANFLSSCPRLEIVELLIFAGVGDDFERSPAILAFTEMKSMDFGRGHLSGVGVREGVTLDMRIIGCQSRTNIFTHVKFRYHGKTEDEEEKLLMKQHHELAYNAFISDGKRWFQRPKPWGRILALDRMPWGDHYIIHPDDLD